ncbi:MAG: segregation/condensation protein A [bacterium]|nr:segregation/condensation protein A [bacterium]
MYQLKLAKFEGPLDLLHQLIESKKLEITEISLAEVAGQFLDYLKNSTNLAMEDMANFLNIAGRLTLIKSRALLPFLKLTEEEEKDIQSLKDQLAEYQKYKELAKGIHKLDIQGNRYYNRTYLNNIEPVFYFPKKLTGEFLALSLSNLISTITLPQRIPQAQLVEKVSLEEKIADLEKNIKEKIELNFSQITDSANPEARLITFLSVLELLKRAKITAEQSSNFEDIKLRWQNQQI